MLGLRSDFLSPSTKPKPCTSQPLYGIPKSSQRKNNRGYIRICNQAICAMKHGRILLHCGRARCAVNAISTQWPFHKGRCQTTLNCFTAHLPPSFRYSLAMGFAFVQLLVHLSIPDYRFAKILACSRRQRSASSSCFSKFCLTFSLISCFITHSAKGFWPLGGFAHAEGQVYRMVDIVLMTRPLVGISSPLDTCVGPVKSRRVGNARFLHLRSVVASSMR